MLLGLQANMLSCVILLSAWEHLSLLNFAFFHHFIAPMLALRVTEHRWFEVQLQLAFTSSNSCMAL